MGASSRMTATSSTPPAWGFPTSRRRDSEKALIAASEGGSFGGIGVTGFALPGSAPAAGEPAGEGSGNGDGLVGAYGGLDVARGARARGTLTGRGAEASRGSEGLGNPLPAGA